MGVHTCVSLLSLTKPKVSENTHIHTHIYMCPPHTHLQVVHRQPPVVRGHDEVGVVIADRREIPDQAAPDLFGFCVRVCESVLVRCCQVLSSFLPHRYPGPKQSIHPPHSHARALTQKNDPKKLSAASSPWAGRMRMLGDGSSPVSGSKLMCRAQQSGCRQCGRVRVGQGIKGEWGRGFDWPDRLGGGPTMIQPTDLHEHRAEHRQGAPQAGAEERGGARLPFPHLRGRMCAFGPVIDSKPKSIKMQISSTDPHTHTNPLPLINVRTSRPVVMKPGTSTMG